MQLRGREGVTRVKPNGCSPSPAPCSRIRRNSGTPARNLAISATPFPARGAGAGYAWSKGTRGRLNMAPENPGSGRPRASFLERRSSAPPSAGVDRRLVGTAANGLHSFPIGLHGLHKGSCKSLAQGGQGIGAIFIDSHWFAMRGIWRKCFARGVSVPRKPFLTQLTRGPPAHAG